MNKHYQKIASPSSTPPAKSAKQVCRNVNEHELVNSAEHQAEHNGPTENSNSTTYYANEKKVDRITKTHQLYCFFTRNQL